MKTRKLTESLSLSNQKSISNKIPSKLQQRLSFGYEDPDDETDETQSDEDQLDDDQPDNIAEEEIIQAEINSSLSTKISSLTKMVISKMRGETEKKIKTLISAELQQLTNDVETIVKKPRRRMIQYLPSEYKKKTTTFK